MLWDIVGQREPIHYLVRLQKKPGTTYCSLSATSRTLPSVERRGEQVRGREGNRLRAWLLQARYRRSEVRGFLLQRSSLYTFPLGAVASTSPAMVMWLYHP